MESHSTRAAQRWVVGDFHAGVVLPKTVWRFSRDAQTFLENIFIPKSWLEGFL